MADLERVPEKRNEQASNPQELERVHHEQKERIDEARREQLAQSPEKSPAATHELTREATEQAKSKEKDPSAKKAEHENVKTERRHDKIVPKAQRAAAYKRTMKQVQTELPPVSRTFSKFIHNKVVERVSDVVGSTIARPNAILTGSLLAFVFTLAIFLIARYYGYPLSGSETIAAFILGWLIGLLADYLRLEFTGGKS